MGFASGSAVELSNATMQEMEARDMGSIPASGKSRERKWQLIPVFLPGKSQSVGCRESDMTGWLTTTKWYGYGWELFHNLD